jgi:4-hydroxybenzoate polyprenyltransferase
MSVAERPAALAPSARRSSTARAALEAMRPQQWSKNLLLFAGLIFAAELNDPLRWAHAIAAFAAYCLASSACYLVNDVVDAPHDRLHPVKRERPVASGRLEPRSALSLAAGLLVAVLALAAVLPPWSFAFLAGFVALQAAYTFRLKRIVLIDVMTIAALFVIRAAAGAVAVSVRISPWLLLCTALLALFLGLAKRRGELVLVGAARTTGRPVLEGYSLALVDQLISVVAASTVIAYSLYTFTARDSKAMMATIPFVLFGVFRYLLLIHRDELGEEPEHVLLTDAPIIATVLLWATTSAIILAIY